MANKSRGLVSLKSLLGLGQRRSLTYQQRRTYAAAASPQIHLMQKTCHFGTSLRTSSSDQPSIPSPTSSESKKVLNFVKQRPLLAQLNARTPDDGHYPRIKLPEEYNEADIDRLLAKGKWALIQDTILAMKSDTKPELVGFLAQRLHDKSFELCQLLYFQMKEQDIPISTLVMNYLLQNAVQHNQYQHSIQLLYEATITDIALDMNTYIKLLSQVYFDFEVNFDRKDYIIYLYTLYANDHSPEDFQFGTELVKEFIENNMAEFSSIRETSKKHHKNKHHSHKQGENKNQAKEHQTNSKSLAGIWQGEMPGMKEDGNFSDQSVNGDDDSGSHYASRNNFDQYSENQKRTNLYKKEMSKTKSNLKKQNRKNLQATSQFYKDQTSKHISKYQQMQQQEQNQQIMEIAKDSQIIVDISNLKEIDSSPSNIKELAKMMTDQFFDLLTKQVSRQTSSSEPSRPKFTSGDRYGASLNQQLDSKVLQFDMNEYRKKQGQHQTAALAQQAGAQVRDEKFSLETFYNTLNGKLQKLEQEQQQQNSKVSSEAKTSGEENQYTTTQEEATSEGVGLQSRTGNATENMNQQSSQSQAPASYDSDAREDLERKSIIKEESKENVFDKRESSSKVSTTGDDKGTPNKN